MEIEITKPNKRIDWKQIQEESGVALKGIKTKGDKIWFEDISQTDVDKIETALKTHIPIPKVITTAEEKLEKIRQILNS